MACHICVNCGGQYPFASSPPSHCLICEDERHYVGKNGQEWTTREEMLGKYKNQIDTREESMTVEITMRKAPTSAAPVLPSGYR
jgi:hypothetical protein